MDQINKLVLNSPTEPSTCLLFIDGILRFIVPSDKTRPTHLFFMSLRQPLLEIHYVNKPV